jgi:outer membrane protein TolC
MIILVLYSYRKDHPQPNNRDLMEQTKAPATRTMLMKVDPSQEIKNSPLKSYFSCSLVFLFILLLQSSVHAQTNVRKDTARRISADSSAQVEAKLVDLAFQGPEVKRVEHESEVAQYQLQTAKSSWMNFLTISANYNDQSFKQSATTAYVYPKYFFGLTIPLGTMISGKQTKIAKESVVIGNLTEEETRRRVRADVIGKYRQYKSYTELINLQSELLNDVEAALLQTEDKFRKGSITFDLYNAAQKNKNDEVSKLINLQLQQDLIKLDIERMIGTSLESVIK